MALKFKTMAYEVVEESESGYKTLLGDIVLEDDEYVFRTPNDETFTGKQLCALFIELGKLNGLGEKRFVSGEWGNKKCE